MLLIIGANGQLGRAVREEALRRSLPYVGHDHKTLDVTDPNAVRAFFAENRGQFDCIINCAAYTHVDAAETHAAQAYAANAFAPWLLAKSGIPLLHVSTDYVFNGQGTAPYAVDAPTAPVSVYGLTKRAGETALLESGACGAIVRTAWVYSGRPGTKNFYHTMRRLGSERESLGVVNDQTGAPTLAEDLASAILGLYAKGAHRRPMHLLHFTNAGQCTWHDFAAEILKRAGARAKLNPIPTSAYPTPAQRPAYSVLDLSAIEQMYGIRPRHWQEALRDAETRSYTEAPLGARSSAAN